MKRRNLRLDKSQTICTLHKGLAYRTYKELLDINFFQKSANGSSHCGAVEMNPTLNHEVAGLIPGLVQWVGNSVLP